MRRYQIAGLPTDIASAARVTRKAPGYGHPVHQELATGTGPCRSCLQLFEVGEEDRLLFTYQPDSGQNTLGAPGPIFIHADECERYVGSSLTDGLAQLPIMVEARTHDGRTPRCERTPGDEADRVIRDCLGDPNVDFVALRHGEAGCFLTRVDRV